ncbi:Protein NRT1/ PTR FAMILY 1.2 [Zea mays]|nr:Protein NRT1/ PTR FAMILY 1.2 [Zea mays]
MGSAESAMVLFIYQAATNFLPIFGAIVSDALLGRFLTISLTLFACTIGAVLLWLTTVVPTLVAEDCSNEDQSCHSPTTLQFFVLLTSLLFLSIGASGVRPCSLPFGVDQFTHWSGAPKDRALKVLFGWYYVSMGGSAIISITLIVYLQDKLGWKIGFAISMVIAAFAAILNIVTSPLYIKVKPQKSTWISLVQVVFIAIRNRHIQLPKAAGENDLHYCNVGGLAMVPSSKMRFLNRACVLRAHVESSNTEVLNSWSVCTVEQVEDIKRVLSVIPMWSATITSLLIQTASFRVLQAETMDRHVGSTRFQMPAGSVAIFEGITFTLVSGCITGREKTLSHKQKMGIGVLFSIACALSASVVEAIRRKQATRQGLENNTDDGGVVNMSVLWLAPQCVFAGLISAFGSIGQIEFYYEVLPKSMSSLALALLPLAIGVANIASTVVVKLVKVITCSGGRVGWLLDNLNQGHYDYFYFVLAMLGIAGFIYFVACCYWFEEPSPNQLVQSNEDEPNMR